MKRENAEIYINDGDNERFEVTVGDHVYEGLFAYDRIDRATLPKGWYAYDLKEDVKMKECVEIKNGDILVNHFGTFLTETEIEEIKEKDSSLVRSVFYNQEPQEFDYSFV